MTAQPLDYGPAPIDRPRTVGAIRRALPTDQRARFQAALDDADPAELFALVGLWAAVAQTAADPDTNAAAAAVRDGSATTHTIGDVFPALTGIL